MQKRLFWTNHVLLIFVMPDENEPWVICRNLFQRTVEKRVEGAITRTTSTDGSQPLTERDSDSLRNREEAASAGHGPQACGFPILRCRKFCFYSFISLRVASYLVKFLTADKSARYIKISVLQIKLRCTVIAIIKFSSIKPIKFRIYNNHDHIIVFMSNMWP